MFRIDRFSIHILLAFVGTVLVAHLIEKLPGLDAGAAVFVTLPLLIAAMLEGQDVIRRQLAKPTPQQCWKVAFSMGACTAILTVLVMVLATVVVPAASRSIADAFFATDTRLIALMAVSTVPLLRIGYGIGIATELKGRQAPRR
ncbi:MAG: ABZJ_00895 family protein [Roseobacter sp.]|nr:ABZJ_00895 family protein [Roseobacter sp.]